MLALGACTGPSSAKSADWFTHHEEARRDLVEMQRFPVDKDSRGQAELLHVRRFFESFPHCGSEDVASAIELGRLPPTPGEGEVRVRGFLATRGGACNLGSCTSGVPGVDNPRCCNECSHGSWFVSAPGVKPEDVVVLGGESPSSYWAGWNLMDCTVQELHDNTPLREVIVRGAVKRWEQSPEDSFRPKSWQMRVSQLCVLENPSARVFGNDVTRASMPR